jgi:hypothetical protein
LCLCATCLSRLALKTCKLLTLLEWSFIQA